MSESFGNGVSRTLSALNRQFDNVVWQKGKPPLDSELNLMSQIDVEKMQEIVKSAMNSGFIIDPTVAIEDFQFHKQWANFFKLGVDDGTQRPVLYANVGGMIVPICGTDLSGISNKIKLSPPPESDSRVDFVFLEVWKTLVAPNPSTLNKPSADKVYKYGNVLFGGANISDDLEDPNIGFETSERVQIQYKIRVYGNGVGLGSGVALQDHPDGLGDPNILGQGSASSPVGGFHFHNMKDTLSDPSLWRAGDGDPNNSLGTIDGYVYAIPICAVFRRNSNPFVATNISGNPNQNGGFERTPGSKFLSNPRDGAKTLTNVSLTNNLPANFVGEVQVNDLIGSGLDDSYHTIQNVQLIIDNEIVSVSAININTNPTTITISERARFGTASSGHLANTQISIFNTRADGSFSDEITKEDVLDLRRSVTFGEWDYQRLLQDNLASLMKGQLHSAFKRSSIGDTEGPVVTEVSYLFADGTTNVPNHTEPVDGPDGIRTAFSDSATIERDVCLLLDNDTTLVNGLTSDQFDTNIGWDIAPDFKPSGFLNFDGANGFFTNGSIIFLHIGGEDGSSGARNSFRDSGEKGVRFLTPREFWKTGYPIIDPNNGNQYPVTIKFIDQKAHYPSVPNESVVDSNAEEKHPGPMFPVRTHNFETPFIVLGGLLNSSLKISNISSNTQLFNMGTDRYEIDLGIDFDVVGGFYSLDSNGDFESDPTKVNTPLFHKERTLYDMITNYGEDESGDSSEIYVVVYGDTETNAKDNNGCFKVIGAGTVGYTHKGATTSTRIRVKPLDPEFNNGFYTTSTGSVTVEFRSQHTHTLDGEGLTKGNPSLCIVLTDLQGLMPHKWNKATLDNTNGSLDHSMPTDTYDGRTIGKIGSKLLLSTSLIYEPNRGATARVADVINTVAMENADNTLLRQSKGVLDTGFSSLTGSPSADVEFLPTHIQLWNRLPSKGWHAPDAPSYGGRVIANSEQDRESEVFFDRGSKTLVLRPYRARQMTVQGITSSITTTNDLTTLACLVGRYTYPNIIPKDGLTLFTGDQTSGKKMGYAIPSECMPRFGRQDIPFSSGSGQFLYGINHLFIDSTELNNNVFKIIGGEDNISGGSSVKPLFFRTNAPAKYGESGTVIGAALNKPYYEARKSTDIGSSTTNQKLVRSKFRNVRSSDLGSGLKGIQLPPYLGPARIYGIYDYDDYIANGGKTYTTDRVSLETGGVATNLLRSDNHTQSLFIMRDGAIDLTNETGDHTYIIPSNAIDVTLSPNHNLNDSSSGKRNFEDFDYVVECVVFGFSKDWINGNTYVLARRHHSQGQEIVDGSNEQLEDINMVFPCAAPLNSRVQVTYNRTVYQGDPYFTRYGNVKTITDYERRYGQISSSNTHQLAYPIQQFDDNGNSIIETPNKRVFQVLASVDFYTTMGTGKIGGELYAGTLMDTGYLENTRSRIASSETENRLQVTPRAFTDSQIKNSSRSKVKIQQKGGDASLLEGWKIEVMRLDGKKVTICFKQSPTNPSTWPPYYFEVMSNDDHTLNMYNLNHLINVMVTYTGGLGLTCYSIHNGNSIELYSVATGEQGNKLQIRIVPSTFFQGDLNDFFLIHQERNNQNSSSYQSLGYSTPSKVFFAGGKDIPTNGGNGTSQINLGGMTERFPLGILLNDSDFICENPLNDMSSAVQTFSSSIRPLQKLLPLTEQGEEVDRFLGVPSEYLVLSDGGVLNYTSFDQTDRPTGTRKFRVFRGAGGCMLVGGKNPGGPLEFVSGSLSAPLQPVLKSGALVGKALLVKNYEESVFNDPTKVMSFGEEIQMIIVTSAVLGNPNTIKEGITLQGEISPSGYGEGYSSADRYRLKGKPMFAPNTQKHPNIDIDPVPFLKGE